MTDVYAHKDMYILTRAYTYTHVGFFGALVVEMLVGAAAMGNQSSV